MNVYHAVPAQMIGHILMPLNQMVDVYPKLYAGIRQKYQDREEVMQKQVPLLNCFWNDVIQFLPLHPRKVFELQLQLGIIPEIPPYRFFEINLNKLDSAKTVVYFKSAPGEDNVVVKWISDVDLRDLQSVPTETSDYYKTLVGTGNMPFNYQFIPHILYLGTVDIASVKVISINQK